MPDGCNAFQPSGRHFLALTPSPSFVSQALLQQRQKAAQGSVAASPGVHSPEAQRSAAFQGNIFYPRTAQGRDIHGQRKGIACLNHGQQHLLVFAEYHLVRGPGVISEVLSPSISVSSLSARGCSSLHAQTRGQSSKGRKTQFCGAVSRKLSIIWISPSNSRFSRALIGISFSSGSTLFTSRRSRSSAGVISFRSPTLRQPILRKLGRSLLHCFTWALDSPESFRMSPAY